MDRIIKAIWLGIAIAAVACVPVRDAAHLRTRMALVRIGEIAELAVLREGRQIVIRAAMAQAAPDASSKR